jgi:hypothetical protein
MLEKLWNSWWDVRKALGMLEKLGNSLRDS